MNYYHFSGGGWYKRCRDEEDEMAVEMKYRLLAAPTMYSVYNIPRPAASHCVPECDARKHTTRAQHTQMPLMESFFARPPRPLARLIQYA